ncbi:MAG: hypothetical protein ABMA13_23470 [Chthoniobacteraceae bacterium]
MARPGADYIGGMAQDPKTIRFNTADSPNRLSRFEKAIKRSTADGGEVIRQLTDAFCRYVETHGHTPAWPVELVPLPIGPGKVTAIKRKR